MELEPGAAFGRYEILVRLGTGAMAAVYRAYHPALDRTVAIKVIRPEFTDDPEFVDRFHAEAQAIARLRHPNVVQVHDFDVLDGRHFIVMEHIEGGSLAERLADLRERGRWVSAEEAVRIVSEVADGLGYAHSRGILHRDVKPANILLTREGRAVIGDVGLARLVTSAARTRTGTWVGTPEYMSPEQARGIGVDARSDVYSLGVVAYELFTGRRPYEGDSPLAIALARIHDPLPPPRSIAPGIGETTERVIVAALALDPAQRYPTATELAHALAAAVAKDAGRGAEVGSVAGPAIAAGAVVGAAPSGGAVATIAPTSVPSATAPLATISIALPGARPAVLVAGAIVLATLAGVVGGRALLADRAPASTAQLAPAGGGPLDLRGLQQSQLPRGPVVLERSSTFVLDDFRLGPFTAPEHVSLENGVVRLTAADPPAEVALRGARRPMYVATYVVFIDPASEVRLDLCVRVSAAQERYCFSLTRDGTDFQLQSRGRIETIAKGPPAASFGGEKTLTVFAQLSTFTLYDGDRTILEVQDARLPQGGLDPGIGVGRVGAAGGTVTLKGLRVWELRPPPR